MDVDSRRVRQLLAKRPLQLCAGPCRGGECDIAVQLGVHAQVQRAIVLALHGHVVEVTNATVARGRCMNALDEVAGACLPFDQHRQVERGQRLASDPLHLVDHRTRGLDR